MRTLEQYQQALQSLHDVPPANEHASPEEADATEANVREFFAANVHHLLPALATHPSLYTQVRRTQAVADLDEASYFLLEHTEVADPHATLATLAREPALFATFHFGSYRLINTLLVKLGLNYVLPVESGIYSEQRTRFGGHVNEARSYFGSRSELLVVEAQAQTSALTMARKARAGWSILAYVDGNTGAQRADPDPGKLVRVPLLGKPLYARKGIAFLSHFLGLPMVPVFCEILSPLERRMTLHAPIRPVAGQSRDAYCQYATEQLYTLLGLYLAHTPGQWLGWLDMHKYLDLDSETGSLQDAELDDLDEETEHVVKAERLVFNHERFGFIQTGTERVVLDKWNYKLLSAPASVLAVLEACEAAVPVSGALVRGNRKVIEQLLALQLLVPSVA